MKFATLAIATTAALATTVNADACTTLQLVTVFLPILADSNYAQCEEDGNYTFYPFTALPTDEQLAALCASSACQTLLTELAAMDIPDCTVTTNGQTLNIKELITTYSGLCTSS